MSEHEIMGARLWVVGVVTVAYVAGTSIWWFGIVGAVLCGIGHHLYTRERNKPCL